MERILNFEIDTWVNEYFISDSDFVKLYYNLRCVEIDRPANVNNYCLNYQSQISQKVQLPFAINSGICVYNTGNSILNISFKRNSYWRPYSKKIKIEVGEIICLKENIMRVNGFDYLLISPYILQNNYSYLILKVEF